MIEALTQIGEVVGATYGLGYEQAAMVGQTL
jgi:hypothetical protein